MGTNARSNRGPIEARLKVWRNRFREFSAGGSTVEQFCRQVGVTAATFYYWKKKLADADAERPAPVPLRPYIALSSSQRSSATPRSISIAFTSL